MNIVVDEHMGSLKLSLTYLKATILGYAHGWKNSGFVFTALEIKKSPPWLKYLSAAGEDKVSLARV